MHFIRFSTVGAGQANYKKMREAGLLSHDISTILVHVDPICLYEHRLGMDRFPTWGIVLCGAAALLVILMIVLMCRRRNNQREDARL